MGEVEMSHVQTLVERHQADPEALVEILRELNQQSGYLTREAIVAVAEALHLPVSRVFSVASFYSMISLEPVGQHVIRFCEDAPCHVVGGRQVWQALEAALGIQFGETTPDGKWTLLPTSCIGLCAVGPVMMVDNDVYGNLTPEKVPEILARYTGGAQ